ncbi:MAG: ABC transporter ATP-binding protein, partial [Proteobacteria bacterium]|nr:ABC transporter ATP-binding protein [Pseudomonadota bacterium]
IQEGEFLTMLGPSGCGKTTTLRIIGGFEFPDSGKVILDGEDITDLPPYHRPVNMMFQDFALFPHMTVAENIGYGLKIAGLPKSEVASQVKTALHTIDLEDKENNRPHELSVGQRQRVALARALVRRPKVLLLDEPMSALDAKLREAMQVELKHLHEQIGLTFVMVTHDQTEAMVMSDRVMVMDKGRLVQVGTPSELYDRPSTPYVADFLGTSNMLVARVREVTAENIVAEYGTVAFRVTAKGRRPAVGSEVMLSIRPEKVRLKTDGMQLPEGYNEVPATMREHFFHGDSARLSVDIGGKKLLMVHHQLDSAASQRRLPKPGESITLTVDPAAVTLFEEVAAYEAEERL